MTGRTLPARPLASATLAPSEQRRAATIASAAFGNPRLIERLSAQFVAIEAVFADARRNRYLMTAPTVRPLIDRANAIARSAA